MNFSSFTTTVAVIGGGFSGTMVCVHLLRNAPPGTRVILIERSAALGRGVAYGTECSEHLLNVPAGRLSAFADEPAHFLNWANAQLGNVNATDFLPRRLYGEYVNAILQEAVANPASEVEFESVHDEAVDLDETETGARLTLKSGRILHARSVVLALGNLPGEYPIPRALPFYQSARYVHIPWRAGALDHIGEQDAVLLVGAGLTAVDLMVQLDQRGHRGMIHAVSRRGLVPFAHEPGSAYPPFLSEGNFPTTIRETLRRVRKEIRTAAAQGIGWRAVIDALRPQSQALWKGFSWEERARFMRHVRPHWEVHRHRLAPQVAATIRRLTDEGRVKFYAGRLQSLVDTEGGAAALFRRRGTDELVALRVAKVINCTGPRSDYSKYQHPLLINLLARGLIDHDPLALGIAASPLGEVLRYRSGPTGWLFTLGAPLKGTRWESSAIPELRQQAQTLAAHLAAIPLDSLARKAS